MKSRNGNLAAHDVLAGIAIVAGLFRTWVVGDVLLLFTGFPYRRPPLWLILLGAPFLLTVFWTDSIAETILFPVRLYLLWSTMRHVQNPKAFLWIITIGMIIQSTLGAFVFLEHRPIVFSGNSQQFGSMNFALIAFNPIAAAIGVGISGARFPVALMGIWFLFNRNIKTLIAVGIAGTLLFVGVFSQGDGRRLGIVRTTSNDAGFIETIIPEKITFDPVKSDLDVRLDNATGEKFINDAIAIHTPERLKDSKARIWEWHGYGYASYNQATGIDKPHNTFILAWYELGIFSIVLIIVALMKLPGLPLSALAVMLLYALLIDDWIGVPYGMYATAVFLYAISHRRRSAAHHPAISHSAA